MPVISALRFGSGIAVHRHCHFPTGAPGRQTIQFRAGLIEPGGLPGQICLLSLTPPYQASGRAEHRDRDDLPQSPEVGTGVASASDGSYDAATGGQTTVNCRQTCVTGGRRTENRGLDLGYSAAFRALGRGANRNVAGVAAGE